jgi:hypothetical protein
MRRLLLTLVLLFLPACLSGEATVSGADVAEMGADQDVADPLDAPDLFSPLDMASDLAPQEDMSLDMSVDMSRDMPPDMMAPDLCQGVTCGQRAMCVAGQCRCEAGLVGDPQVACMPADPCAQVSCTQGATCAAGQCRCSPGFVGNGQTCTPVSPGDTALRTRAEVCQRWMADYGARAQAQWQTEPADMCDPGVLHPDVVDDALRRLSLYRWLVGLGPVTARPEYQRITQACATVLAASNRGLSHSLDQSWTCYSQDAAAGAGSSNIAQGVGAADSVDLYIQDHGVPSLGHRRWVFNPPMGATGFGQRGGYSCMYSFDQSVGANPHYVAYPAPGFFPRDAVLGVWSFSSNRYSLGANATVTIRDVASNATLTVSDIYAPGGGYGQPTLAWTVAGAQNDVEYEITLDNIGPNGPVTYRTTLISCP